jgi:ribonuclease HII
MTFLSPAEIRQLSLPEIKERLNKVPASDEIINALEQDPRAGARRLAGSMRLMLELAAKKRLRAELMSRHERELRQKGYKLIAGCDEAGRGALAGPLVGAAVVLNADAPIDGLDDSKKLTAQVREKLFDEIKNKAVCWAVAEIPADWIDEHGIQAANLTALARAVQQLIPRPEFVLSDAFRVDTELPLRALIKGDTLSISIAAASIVAKVHRDRIMMSFHEQYDGYGFSGHKGYGTLNHLEAINYLGASPIHRRSFYPISELVDN